MTLMLALLQAGMGGRSSRTRLLALATMFGAGLLTSLTPCVYPMIPITAGIIAGTAGDASRAAASCSLTLTYVAGLALLYALLGLIAGLTGTLFGTVSASPWARWHRQPAADLRPGHARRVPGARAAAAHGVGGRPGRRLVSRRVPAGRDVGHRRRAVRRPGVRRRADVGVHDGQSRCWASSTCSSSRWA
jgi:hypothetical protein